MTTSSAFSIPPNKDPFYGNDNAKTETGQAEEPLRLTKEDLLKTYIDQFLRNEITEAQLKVIRKTLE